VPPERQASPPLRVEAERQAILPLRLEAVTLRMGRTTLLEDIDFRLTAGPCTVVLGPNGSGKTQLLRICDGLVAPTSGRVVWEGPAAARAAEARALVFQRPVLLRRSAAANIDYALRLRGLPSQERARRIERVLTDTRLADLADRPARRLSIGEQQRLALARAWALEPAVLFLDEPASALDPGSTGALESAIRTIRGEGTKIVMTTHDLAQAQRMADEVLFLDDGRLLEQTAAADFFAEPETAPARKFLRGEIL
jgi:tungstate transport system ATP-binding protein